MTPSCSAHHSPQFRARKSRSRALETRQKPSGFRHEECHEPCSGPRSPVELPRHSLPLHRKFRAHSAATSLASNQSYVTDRLHPLPALITLRRDNVHSEELSRSRLIAIGTTHRRRCVRIGHRERKARGLKGSSPRFHEETARSCNQSKTRSESAAADEVGWIWAPRRRASPWRGVNDREQFAGVGGAALRWIIWWSVDTTASERRPCRARVSSQMIPKTRSR
jgi:hypothetical protein